MQIRKAVRRDEIAAFTGDKKGEAMRKAKIFAQHISLSYGKRDNYDGTKTELPDYLIFRWRDLDGNGDTFSIIE